MSPSRLQNVPSETVAQLIDFYIQKENCLAVFISNQMTQRNHL